MFRKSVIISSFLLVGFLLGVSFYHFKFFPFNQINKTFEYFKEDQESKSLKKKSDNKDLRDKHKIWAKKIVEGGYILHIRHAMREKWVDVTAYDALELMDSVDARKTSYFRAVCLTEKGVEDAKLMNKVFELSGLKVSRVLSSPSCRSRETAIFAFKRIDQIEPSILHRTAQKTSQHIPMGNKLRNELDKIKIEKYKNIIISGHGGTLDVDYENGVGIVDIKEIDIMDDRLETGIIVIERKNNKYIARHKFKSIYEFVTNFFDLPLEDNSDGKFLFDNNDYNPLNIKPGFIFHPDDTG